MPLLLKASNPKARKAQQCIPCCTVIEPGTIYRRETYVANDLYDWVICVDCWGIINSVCDWAHGEANAETFEEWADDNRDNPAALAFLTRCFPVIEEVK